MEPTHGIETLEPADLVGIDDHDRTPTPRRTRRIVEHDDHLVVKEATTSGRDDLRREAEVLEALRGPDVVSMVSLDDGPESTRLTLRDTGGPSLAAALVAPTTTARDRMLLLAAACRTVAGLHASGWAHGRLCADHVLLTSRGRTRLCSLADAHPVQVDPATARLDRIALLRMVDDLTVTAHQAPRRRILERIRTGLLARRTARLPDDPDPLVLARILDRCAGRERRRPDRWLPRAPTRGITTRRRGRPSPAAAGVASVVLAVTVAAVLGSSTFDDPPSVSTASADPSSSRTSDRAAPTASVIDGVVMFDGRRYRVGDSGDLVAVGDWDCDGTSTVAIITSGSDAVQVFDEWATAATPATARTIGHVPGATSISADGTRCGPPRVTTVDDRTIRVELEPS